MATYGSIRYSGIEDAGVAGGGVESYADVNALPASPTVGDLALITGTNKLYVYDGTSWFNIAIVNQAPTAITGNEASYALALDGTPTVVTLVSTDPEGFPLTWSATTSGDTQVGTLAQADNVFTITPSTNEADIGTLSVTFSVTDGTNTENSTSTFRLAFVSALWDETTLSIGTSSTNSLDNSTFIDRSSNAHSITANGDATQTAFHPYLDNWSNYFDGAGDYLRATDASLAEGTDDFTLECWFWMPSSFSPGVNDSLFAHDGTPGYQISWRTSGFCFMGDGSNRVLNTNTLTTDIFDAWHHIAYARVGDTLYGFLDGNLIGTSTHVSVSTNFTNTTIDIGVNRGGTGYVNAYISNLRIVKGTALYTSTFTPPTEKLTAVSGTTLLTCQNNRFIDNSTNAHTITANGDAKVSAFNPFGQESEYAVGENKGSTYFDGSGDYLSTTLSGNLSGDFTIECWLLGLENGVTADPAQRFFVSKNSDSNTADNLQLGIGNNTASGVTNNAPFVYTDTLLTASSESIVNQGWNHVAVTRSGSSLKLFVNGVQKGSTATTTTTFVLSNSFIGTRGTGVGNDNYYGYMSDFRVVNGTALYTSAFTPPTSPVGNTNASLYLPMDNAGIYDKTGNTTFVPGGSVATSTSQTKFADTSIYFAGNGNYAYDLNVNSWSFGTGDFTWEMWTNFSDIAIRTIASFLTSINSTHPYLYINSSANIVYYVGGTNYITSSSTVSINTWYHIALVRNSGTTTLYIDGTNVGSFNDSFNYVNGSLLLGSYYNPAGTIYTGSEMYGYIENLQILKGVAKYTANFTPPTSTQGRTYQEES